MNRTSTTKLANGVQMPVVGFGTWQTPDGEVAKESVKAALAAGYRHIDTAAAYGNETSVGEGIRESGIAREEIFLTTKLWNGIHTYEAAKMAIEESLRKLGTDYVDLYLIHWPNPIAVRDRWQDRNAGVWRAMEEALERGLIKAIGVSNFRGHHLDALAQTATVQPMVNQIYLSPSDAQPEVVSASRERGLVVQAYSPLGTGTLLEVPEIVEIGAKYGKSPAQVAIRWSVQNGFVPLPKSVTPSRIAANFDVFDFELSKEDMAVLDALKGSGRMALNPDEATF